MGTLEAHAAGAYWGAWRAVPVLYPKAGGNYVFLREAYGRAFGFLWGWVDFWIIRSASIAALASMFTDSFHDVLRQILYPGQGVATVNR